ncbi:hypothetical protein HNR20_001398 [Micromonospora parathelypteridis]|uniref:Uncharacterized protein n=1 Tax=Micromonospora parathelypteridis TaxID=1839617 RepID=A0A840VJ23_9ACTN|nr:hypothetical protein [Micromonospora parathelypteridis]
MVASAVSIQAIWFGPEVLPFRQQRAVRGDA